MTDPGRAGRIVFSLVSVIIIGIFAWLAKPGFHEIATPGAENGYYNLLVQGFRDGQLNVKREAPPGLAAVPNPYDPAVNKLYVWDSRCLCHDMSYYKGKLYLYFGVVPALTLFWPYAVLTGHYLPDTGAVVIFFGLGFLFSAGLLYAMWRRYFLETGVWVLAAGVTATGLGTGILELLPSCDVYEIAISGGFAFAMLAFTGIWKALHDPNRKTRWLLLASLAYGLAIGSRPSLLFGAIILLAPAARAWFDTSEPTPRRQGERLLLPAVIPITFIGLGLMLYNFLRFNNPLEFGWHYLLTDVQNAPARQFSPGYLWFNTRFYFFGPMRWATHFPFLSMAPLPPIPSGHGGVETPFSGIITGYPIACLALAAPLALRAMTGKNVSSLRWFVMALSSFFLICGLTLCLFFAASTRYQIDFVPVLMVLAVIGIFGLEHTLRNWIAWRRLARAAWCLLLGYSILFSALANVKSCALHSYLDGNVLLNQGRVDMAIDYYKKASKYDPHSATYHFALANALSRAGQTPEAAVQYKKALEIKPDFAEADNNLAYTLLQAGHADEAIVYYRKSVEIKPSYQAYYNLGYALRRSGNAAGAIESYQKAIKLQPAFLPPQIDLSWMLATWPDAAVRDGARAVTLAEKLNQLAPNDPRILQILAAAYAETGRFSEAIETANQAMTLARAQSRTTLINPLQAELELYQNHLPDRSPALKNSQTAP